MISNDKEINRDIKHQVKTFNSITSILLCIVGAIFIVSISVLSFLQSKLLYNQNQCYLISYFIFFLLLCLAIFETLLCFVVIMLPRIKKIENKYEFYYKDIARKDIKEIDNKKNTHFSSGKLINNLKIINSKICSKKHKWLMSGLVSLLPFAFLLLVLIYLIRNKNIIPFLQRNFLLFKSKEI